ncbi:MAG: alpha/beta hydrolase [Anaerolineales bacterium]|nr:alpha/beta hydrolase [Anaerolineales bacterium]MCB8960543.1 alpha/beta hydrolase [Ardenticatenales bacterium]MCB0005274.1 alpha/beta hydrolase [Anaerolineales bacterium]MCB0011047.1 alpha/beta hydrolase [Anaerolineales bacterium]MCB0016801.1 alpha/beta hydrolase [Anaerolineales bacterium]
MSSIVTEQGILHYESLGRGRPIILLHGWINSWDVWRDSMIALASSGLYRVYALDFWGFGESAKETATTAFRMDSYVEMVHEFMNRLGIQQSPIFGHSMGGTVALKMALNHPERVSRVAVVGSPINGKTLNPFLKLAGGNWITNLPNAFQPVTEAVIMSTMKIVLNGDSQRVQEMITRDVQKTTIDSFVRSIGDLYRTDLSEQIKTLQPPALGIYGSRDNIVSPKNANVLSNLVNKAEVAMMEQSRHFPMADEPERFVEILSRFLQDGSSNGNSNGSVNGHHVHLNGSVNGKQ